MNEEKYSVVGLASRDGFDFAILYHPRQGMPYIVAKCALLITAEEFVSCANERLKEKP